MLVYYYRDNHIDFGWKALALFIAGVFYFIKNIYNLQFAGLCSAYDKYEGKYYYVNLKMSPIIEK